MAKASTVCYILSNIITVLVVGICILLIYLLASPFGRGFYCNDQSILYPYKEDTVSILVAIIIGALIFAIPIFSVELVRHFRKANEKPYHRDQLYSTECLTCCNTSASLTIIQILRYLFLAIFGAICTLFFTEMMKRQIGRHRPHFLAICNPDLSHPKYNCSTYIPLDVCRPLDAKKFKEAQLSFPSGHASFSIYATVFAALYLQARVNFLASHFFKNSLQLVFIIWGIFVCCSRVSDYKHHWSDVLSGGLIGLAVALLTGLKIVPNYVNCCQASVKCTEEEATCMKESNLTSAATINDAELGRALNPQPNSQLKKSH